MALGKFKLALKDFEAVSLKLLIASLSFTGYMQYVLWG